MQSLAQTDSRVVSNLRNHFGNWKFTVKVSMHVYKRIATNTYAKYCYCTVCFEAC
jgi:hypothetical protein